MTSIPFRKIATERGEFESLALVVASYEERIVLKVGDDCFGFSCFNLASQHLALQRVRLSWRHISPDPVDEVVVYFSRK